MLDCQGVANVDVIAHCVSKVLKVLMLGFKPHRPVSYKRPKSVSGECAQYKMNGSEGEEGIVNTVFSSLPVHVARDMYHVMHFGND